MTITHKNTMFHNKAQKMIFDSLLFIVYLPTYIKNINNLYSMTIWNVIAQYIVHL